MNSIPEPKELVNLILSKLQKKTPTIVHKQFSIQKIRQFYIRKIKFFHQEFEIFIEKIARNFPSIDQLHPFFCDLFNILFNRDNYKLALFQLNKSKKKISEIAKNYLKLLKYGKSLYNCKQIKKVALGKMCKKIQKIKNSLKFLEKIRLQLKIIPKIDPHKKIILLAGSNGVGKSSILNKITCANVLVKNDMYSTKSLMLGHLVFKFFRWQFIETPAINSLDFKFLNSIEMLSINAFINLEFIITYLIDLSPNSYYSIEKQMYILCKLKKILKKKKKIFLLTKTDLDWEKILNNQTKTILTNLNNFDINLKMVLKNSSHDEIGLITIKEQNCHLKLEKNKKKFQKFPFKLKKFSNETWENRFFDGNGNNKNLKEIKNLKRIFSPSYRNFFFKNFFSCQKKKKYKEINSVNREEKYREYKNEEKFAFEKIKSRFFAFKNFKACKIFQKNLYFLKSAFLVSN